MNLRQVTGTFTRPNDTDAYAIGDVVANSTTAPVAINFANASRSNDGSNTIIDAMLIDSAAQATKGQFELWLFKTAPTMDNDNAAFTPTDAELLNLVGIIDFTGAPRVGDATAGAGGNAVYYGKASNGSFEPKFRTKVASRILYGVLVVRNAYTPVADEVFTIVLTLD